MAEKKSKKTLPVITGSPSVPENFPKPLHNRIIISTTKPETVSQGGIIIPDVATEQQNKGYIMAVGPLVENPSVVPGKLAVYGQYSGVEIEHDGREYLIMRETDLLYIL